MYFLALPICLYSRVAGIYTVFVTVVEYNSHIPFIVIWLLTGPITIDIGPNTIVFLDGELLLSCR